MKKKLQILVGEDNPVIAGELKKIFSPYGRVYLANNYEDARRVLDTATLNLAFLDLNLGVDHHEGINLVKICKHLNIPSIVLTSHEEKEVIGQAFMAGCQAYYVKNNFIETPEKYLHSVLRQAHQVYTDKLIREHYITQDPSLLSQLEYLYTYPLDQDSRVLLLGETGVGKTKLAKLIHEISGSQGKLVHQNLLEIPETLFESTLFGHKKGAFTGAISDKVGLLEQADGGTLFLDEIGALPLHMQKKLLRVIEEKSFNPLGSNKTIHVDFRLISATCDDLSAKIENGDFRLDFYFRIKGLEINIPPLRKRVEDIPLLVDAFNKQSTRKIFIHPDVINEMKKFSWPGNIRELAHIYKQLQNSSQGMVDTETYQKQLSVHSFSVKKKEELKGDKILSLYMLKTIKENGLPSLINQLEKEAMVQAMKESRGKINEVQRFLKISKSLLYRIHQDVKDEKGEDFFEQFSK